MNIETAFTCAMTKLLLALCVAAFATPAAARPMADFRCGKDHIILWTDKSKAQADFAAGKPESEIRPFEAAYNIVLNDKKDAYDPKNQKRLPDRLFSYDTQHNLIYKGKKCREMYFDPETNTAKDGNPPPLVEPGNLIPPTPASDLERMFGKGK
jgi:hypothetical protein